MNKEQYIRTGGTLYVVACFAYVGYEWYSYTGIYRLAAEWQMSTLGSYSLELTFLVSFLVLLIPVGVLAKLLGWDMKTRGAPFSLRGLFAALSPRVLLLVGLMLVAVAAGSGWWWWDEVNKDVTFEVFDLSNDPAPLSTHVTMTGVAHPEYLVEFGVKSELTGRDRYIPITAASWRRSDPLVYFMKATGREGSEFSQHTLPFPVTGQRGVLIKNDLPGPVAEAYRNQNLALAPLPVVLNLSPHADIDPYFLAAFMAGMVGLGCLLTAAKRAVWRRQLPARNYVSPAKSRLLDLLVRLSCVALVGILVYADELYDWMLQTAGIPHGAAVAAMGVLVLFVTAWVLLRFSSVKSSINFDDVSPAKSRLLNLLVWLSCVALLGILVSADELYDWMLQTAGIPHGAAVAAIGVLVLLVTGWVLLHLSSVKSSINFDNATRPTTDYRGASDRH
jgi:hypothetical protein